MTDDRQRILDRVRAALTPLATREPMPRYADDAAIAGDPVGAEDRVGAFVEQLTQAGGRAFTNTRSLALWLAERGCLRGYCDPQLVPEFAPSFPPEFVLDTKFRREHVDSYGFAVTRAVGAIAETGTLILNDATTTYRLAAVAPWIHIAVVRRSAIHLQVGDAIRALGADPNVVWCTGPSKTADVEGILIEGVHGPGEQVALILAPSASPTQTHRIATGASIATLPK